MSSPVVADAVASPEDRRDRIAKLWCEGLSATAVAAIVGDGCTRNVVIGIAHRRGLSNKSGKRKVLAVVKAEPKPPVVRPAAIRVDVRSRVAPAPQRSLPALPAPVVRFDRTKRFACLADALVAHTGGCRWPCEDERGHWVCGGRRFETLRSKIPHSYCAEHYRMSVGRGTDSERKAMQLPKGEK